MNWKSLIFDHFHREINFKFEETDLVDLTRVAVEKCKNLYLNKKRI
jgi:hypothetical protein